MGPAFSHQMQGRGPGFGLQNTPTHVHREQGGGAETSVRGLDGAPEAASAAEAGQLTAASNIWERVKMLYNSSGPPWLTVG